MTDRLIETKYALPYAGSIWVKISYYDTDTGKKYISSGQSRIFPNIRSHRREALNNAIFNAYKRKYGENRSGQARNVINIIILDYTFNYLLYRYETVEKDGKTYDRFRDKEKKRTRYYVRNDKNTIQPDEEYEGISW